MSSFLFCCIVCRKRGRNGNEGSVKVELVVTGLQMSCVFVDYNFLKWGFLHNSKCADKGPASPPLPIGLKTSTHICGSLLSLFSKGKLLKNWLVTPGWSCFLEKVLAQSGPDRDHVHGTASKDGQLAE